MAAGPLHPLGTRRGIPFGPLPAHAPPRPYHRRAQHVPFRPGALEDADVQAAQGLADVATIAILQHQAALNAQALNDQLNFALTSRVLIEQAKGKISEACHVDMVVAFQRLRNHARNHNSAH